MSTSGTKMAKAPETPAANLKHHDGEERTNKMNSPILEAKAELTPQDTRFKLRATFPLIVMTIVALVTCLFWLIAVRQNSTTGIVIMSVVLFAAFLSLWTSVYDWRERLR